MSQDDSLPLIRDIAPFGVRMPPDLKERVSAAAKANNRSMNAEIVATLEEKYPAPTPRSLKEEFARWEELLFQREQLLEALESSNDRNSVLFKDGIRKLRELGDESHKVQSVIHAQLGAPPPDRYYGPPDLAYPGATKANE